MTACTEYQAVSQISKGDLVLQHSGLVKRIAYHLVNRLPPNFDVDDLIQAGMIGLLEAASNYVASKGANFETYAGIRIRGAMLDEVRKSDWTPRSVHRKLRKLSEAVREIESKTGREARDVDVAKLLGMSMTEYQKILRDAMGCRLFSLDHGPGDDYEGQHEVAGEIAPDPLSSLEQNDFKHALADQIDGLPERERLVLSLYYDEELNLKEIGEVLGVSESRVCQIHGQAVVRLKARMTNWTEAG